MSTGSTKITIYMYVHYDDKSNNNTLNQKSNAFSLNSTPDDLAL